MGDRLSSGEEAARDGHGVVFSYPDFVPMARWFRDGGLSFSGVRGGWGGVGMGMGIGLVGVGFY